MVSVFEYEFGMISGLMSLFVVVVGHGWSSVVNICSRCWLFDLESGLRDAPDVSVRVNPVVWEWFPNKFECHTSID